MTDEEWNNIGEIYKKEFSEGMPFDIVSEKLDCMNEHQYIQELRSIFCNILIAVLTEGYINYDDKTLAVYEDSLLKLVYENIEKLDKDRSFYWAFYYYLKKQYKECKVNIHNLCKSLEGNEILDEDGVLDYFLVPFKNAPVEIWEYITKEVKTMDTADGVPEFCDLISLFYRSINNDEVVDALTSFMQKYPEYKSPNEMLGYTYYNMSMWNNTIACFEKVKEEYYISMADIYWMLAWASGKVKNLTDEEEYYRKSYELAPDIPFTLNNLGYSLYRQKKYKEALEIFEKCLREKVDLNYAGNNYVRVLIALGRNADAKKFVKSSGVKVAKALRDRVANLDNHNARIRKQLVEETQEVEETESTQKFNLDIGVKRQQFSNEKLLEDELTARIESGMPVFGMNLKIYKRKGEYGRQYIIPIGRLDLLCEDSQGNLYVVELKKDSGYDDAYKQTAEYLDWFEKDKRFKGKKVYGIICLNSPTKQLIDKVHADKRMRLFEYQISYTEL